MKKFNFKTPIEFWIIGIPLVFLLIYKTFGMFFQLKPNFDLYMVGCFGFLILALCLIWSFYIFSPPKTYLIIDYEKFYLKWGRLCFSKDVGLPFNEILELKKVQIKEDNFFKNALRTFGFSFIKLHVGLYRLNRDKAKLVITQDEAVYIKTKNFVLVVTPIQLDEFYNLLKSKVNL